MTDSITQTVKKMYGAVATSGLSSRDTGVRAVAQAFGYSAEELHSIPDEANIGLSCGNPTAMASLRSGEVVLDLGCGGGLDVFLAAKKVGPTGKAIGVDMTAEMIELARRNARHASLEGYSLEFHLASIDALPLADRSVDCVISNCVINLAPDKPAVFREIVRVLKPGGRLAISDIALKQPLPDDLAADVSALVGCISGALPLDTYRQQLTDAGFQAVEIIDMRADLNAYGLVENQVGCCSPAMAASHLPVADSGCCGGTASTDQTSIHQRLADLLLRYNLNDYAASVKVFAVKPETL